ncbi:DUF930 domain-containing protein [Stappia sp. 28M-7]|uniref:DUF930 domain-containing protein n=1 Tax=Stappia sp. 28M-7 TaxID=2762596 RepID=UPI00163B8E9F|nr:DUF930 domain-containing protein [Stappia sp. 28M-7]MBC2860555.1 DUF930 domain-containing protein [Stappia sp. 28M-7]
MPPASERAGERRGEAVPASQDLPQVAPDPVAESAAGETADVAARGTGLRRRIGAGLALSLLLHGAAAWLVFFGPGAVRALPPTVDEPIEVVLIEPPAAEEQAEEQAEPPAPPPPRRRPCRRKKRTCRKEEAQAAPPPPPPPPPAPEEQTPEETPETPEAPEVAAEAAVPRVLMPVTEFAEEDSGSEDQAGEITLREGLDEPAETAPQEAPETSASAEGQDQPAGEAEGDSAQQGPGEAESEGTADSGETGTAEELAAETPGAEEEGMPQEGAAAPEAAPESAPDAESEAETEVAALTDPSEAEAQGPSDLDVLAAPTEGAGVPAGGTAVPRAKPAEIPLFAGSRADPQSEAEAVARAIAATTPGSGGLSFARPSGGGGEGELAGGTTATRLFSRDISDDPRMRTAMNGMPQAARVDLLCMTELRAQLRTATPPYQPDLLPSFRLESGTVLQPRRAAFRAGGQWYDLAFRCELNTQVTRVESFTFRVGAPVPRSEWSARGFPGN